MLKGKQKITELFERLNNIQYKIVIFHVFLKKTKHSKAYRRTY